MKPSQIAQAMSARRFPTYAGMLLHALKRHADRVAFDNGRQQITYRAVEDFVARAQQILLRQGVQRGDCVALLSSNRWETWCVTLAVQTLGAAITSLHPLASLEQHLFQIDDSQARLLVADVLGYRNRFEEIATARPDLDTLVVGPSSLERDLMHMVEREGACHVRDLSSHDDLRVINYTGGTSGRPKGVMHTSATSVLMTSMIMAEFELPKTPRYLATSPVSHVAGTNVPPVLWRGGTVFLHEWFEPERTIRSIEKERINFTLMVPTMIYKILEHPATRAADLSSLELLLYGAAPMSPTRLAEALDCLGPVLTQLYGQSECYPIARLPKEDHDVSRPELLSACGYPFAGCSVQLLDDAGNPVAMGDPGEICVASPTAMLGYWKQEALTREVFQGGYLHTGDVARQDETGRLYIVDRKKDMIISGGFNVYSREVEDALCAHQAVANAAVYGVPHATWGESIKAVVVLRDGCHVAADELISFVRDLKGSLLAPKELEFSAELPVTALGKIDKKALRSRDWSSTSRNVA